MNESLRAYPKRNAQWRDHVESERLVRQGAPSDRSRTVALALAAVIGVFGAHRFYAGKTGTAFLMLITLGGLGLWWLFDLILIAAGGFRDATGRLIVDWDPGSALGPAHDQQALESAFVELDRMRAEMDDMAERLDFAERLLARPDSSVEQ